MTGFNRCFLIPHTFAEKKFRIIENKNNKRSKFYVDQRHWGFYWKRLCYEYPEFGYIDYDFDTRKKAEEWIYKNYINPKEDEEIENVVEVISG